MPEINTIKKIKKIQLSENIYDIGTDWSNIENKPTTLSGYGITDACSNQISFTLYEDVNNNKIYYNISPETIDNRFIYIFGGIQDSNYIGTRLPRLQYDTDYGKIFHITVKFLSASLSNTNSFWLQEQYAVNGNTKARILSDYTRTGVATGDTIEFDYTLSDDIEPDNGAVNLRIRLNEIAGGTQSIQVKVTSFGTLEQALASKANIGSVPIKTSDLTDDGVYVTQSALQDILEEYTGAIKQEKVLFPNDQQLNNTIIDTTLEASNNNYRVYLLGTGTNSSNLNLPLKDNKTYKIIIDCENVNLNSSDAIRFYHTLGDVVQIDKYDTASSGNTYIFEYTKPQGSTNIFLRFYFLTGVQKINLTVLTTEYNAQTITETLPYYCKNEIENIKTNILNNANYDDVIFGFYTDIHFGNPNVNTDDDTQKWNEIKSMRKIADEGCLDFVCQGGDLLTKGTYVNDTFILNRSQYEFSGCRVPVYNLKGDHDSNQTTQQKISKLDYVKRTAPYSPKAVRSKKYPNNYYFDIPEKYTRVITIDTGTIEAGQGYSGEDFKTWNHDVLYDWLLDEVLTDDIKKGWRIIILTHAPCDYEWQFGLMKQTRASEYASKGSINYSNTRVVRGHCVILNELFTAINNSSIFTINKPILTKYTLTHDENNMLIGATEVDPSTATGETIFPVGNIIKEDHSAYTKTKDFSGWTSKVRMILSGHCHCDRLNNYTLIPDGSGNLTRGTTSYGIAYTGSAAKGGFKSSLINGKTYYNYCFGDNATITDGEVVDNGAEGISNVSWSHLLGRTYGELNEDLMDVWIVGDTYIKRIRFGAGANSTLLSTVLNVDAYNENVANGYTGTKNEWLEEIRNISINN